MLKNKITKSLTLVLVFMLMTSLTAFADVSGEGKDNLSEISTENILEHLNELAPGDDARIAGSAGEKEAADYIEGILKNEYNLDKVEKPSFDTILFHDNGATFTVNTPTNIELTTNGALNMEFTTSGTISNELVYAGLGTLEECTSAEVGGKIALIKRGEYTFAEKVQNAADAGAVGVILFNNIMEEGFINGTLGSESEIPAIEIHPADGENLAAILKEGTPISVSMSASGTIEPVTSQNVIGSLLAEVQKNNTPTIVIGAHYDCVDTPGANDNASGTAALLEIARVLSECNLDANIKFIAFGAEEVGLVGAYDYVESLDKSERNKIAAMINMDMVGVGDELAIWTIGDKPSSVLADLVESYVQKSNINYIPPGVEDRSDHAAFAENGIPSVYFSYEVDPNYHTDNDTIDKIEVENIESVCEIVTEMTYYMAEAPMLQSTQGFHGTANKYKHNPNKSQE